MPGALPRHQLARFVVEFVARNRIRAPRRGHAAPDLRQRDRPAAARQWQINLSGAMTGHLDFMEGLFDADDQPLKHSAILCAHFLGFDD